VCAWALVQVDVRGVRYHMDTDVAVHHGPFDKAGEHTDEHTPPHN